MLDRAFQVGGSLTKDAPSYVVRLADRELIYALQQGEFCYVLNSRQMGKSSLLVSTLHRLEAEGDLGVSIDLTYLGSEFTTPLQWYKGFVAQLWMGLGLVNTVDFKSWWKKQEFSYLQRLGEFIELLLNCFPHQKIFVFIDEIDRIQSLDFPVDDFFALIRYCYNQRAINSKYQRITFALFGVITPGDLIRNKNLTPFNIGRAIALNGFQIHEVEPLIAGLGGNFANPHAVMQEILSWTEGQPFLTQKLCQLLVSTSNGKPFKSENTVNNIIHQYIINNWQSQDEPEHLRTIRDRLLYNPRSVGRLLGIYQQILQVGSVKSDDSCEQVELLLSGLVVKQNNYLKVKNRIYQEVFNSQWVAQQLENLRPYGVNFNAWLKNRQEENLLRGLALKEALAWAEAKQLSDLDYRFLAASQQLAQQETEQNLVLAELEREKAQFALYAVREAHRLLTIARQTANQKVKQLRLPKSRIGIGAIAVFILVIFLRSIGGLQGLELTALDLYFQQRPIIDYPSRITIITIDESDIQNIGQFPLSDRILARSLDNLIRLQPRVIGLDLYRDLPVLPGNQELQQLFESTPNLFGIEKVVGVQIQPPPQLDRLNQVGFADQVFDDDEVIRRALLSIRTNNGVVSRSFALKLALNYLQTKTITSQPLGNKASHIKLGKTLLIPFKSNDGGYVRADAGGYQTLINYQGNLATFDRLSISDLLEDRIPAAIIRDRIVLIGSTASTISDLSRTPYSRWKKGVDNQMAWVTIHANIVAQILSAAIDGREMLCTISEAREWLCIFLSSLLGAYLSWWLRSIWVKAIVIIATIISAILITYLAFLQGWWLPIIPMAISLVFASAVITIATEKQLATMQLEETVKQLTMVSQEQPTASKVAFELLKQGESQQNQELIEKLVDR